ncbi:hypothetical protein D3C80_1560730 [compost metagenome]
MLHDRLGDEIGVSRRQIPTAKQAPAAEIDASHILILETEFSCRQDSRFRTVFGFQPLQHRFVHRQELHIDGICHVLPRLGHDRLVEDRIELAVAKLVEAALLFDVDGKGFDRRAVRIDHLAAPGLDVFKAEAVFLQYLVDDPATGVVQAAWRNADAKRDLTVADLLDAGDAERLAHHHRRHVMVRQYCQ